MLTETIDPHSGPPTFPIALPFLVLETPGMVSSKQDIRKQARARRDRLPALERASKSRRISSFFLDSVARGVRRVGLYAAIGSEVETQPIFDGLRARGVEVCFPRCRSDTRFLDFVPVTELSQLEPGCFGVPEPRGPAVDLQSLELLVIPGVAFDAAGGRIGYGAGYYDSTLSDYRGPVVGIAFEEQIFDDLPREAHDRPVDAVITEAGLLPPRAEVACPT